MSNFGLTLTPSEDFNDEFIMTLEEAKAHDSYKFGSFIPKLNKAGGIGMISKSQVLNETKWFNVSKSVQALIRDKKAPTASQLGFYRGTDGDGNESVYIGKVQGELVSEFEAI